MTETQRVLLRQLQIIVAIFATLVLAAFLHGLTEKIGDKLPSNNPELARVSMSINDSTGFVVLQIHRPELALMRNFLYDKEGTELLDWVDDWNGKTYIGTVKTSDSTRTAIPRDRGPELWEKIKRSYDYGDPFSFRP